MNTEITSIHTTNTNPLNYSSSPGAENAGKAFGVTVEKREGQNLVAETQPDISSTLYKLVDDDYIELPTQEVLTQLRNTNNEIFSMLYSAHPVEEPVNTLSSRYLTPITSLLGTFFSGR